MREVPHACPTAAPCFRRVDAWSALGGAAALALVLAGSSFGETVGRALTHNTIRLSLLFYLAAALLMTRLGPVGWRAADLPGRIARWCWGWAVVVFVVHLAMAFHHYHGWSHASAVAHTQEVTGWGDGVFVSYTFTLLWTADALWWFSAPASYATRSPLLHRTLHAFLLFILFNGTVVFEGGLVRWAGLAAFVLLAAAWWTSQAPNEGAPNEGAQHPTEPLAAEGA